MSGVRGFDADLPVDNLPSGWAWVPVEGLATKEVGALTDGPFGSNLKTSHYTESGPRVIRLQNIGDGVFHDEKAHIAREHFERLRKHEAKPQDIVVAMLGEELPRACLVPDHVGPAIVKADCARLRVDPKLGLPGFVAAGLNSQALRRQADELIHGVGRPRLGLRWLKTLQFPLAPLPEQHRIVGAIESYCTRLDDAVATLERVQRNLKRYRASVLKAAVEGRLVPTEADLARAEGRDYEPARVLLERISAERARRRHEVEGAGTYQEPVPPDISELPDLPEGWAWASVEQFADHRLGKMLDKDKNQGTPHPYLRNANVRWFEFDLADVSEMRVEDSRLDEVSVRAGDVVVCEGGEPGRAAVWQREDQPFVIQKALHRVRPAQGVSPWFFAYLLAADAASGRLGQGFTGSTIRHFTGEALRRYCARIPPEVEQTRIVDVVDDALSLIAAAERAVAVAQRRCARLRQSILKWAFEGRLADQDPSDEPATALLERIQSQTLGNRLSPGDTADRRLRQGVTRRSVRADNRP